MRLGIDSHRNNVLRTRHRTPAIAAAVSDAADRTLRPERLSACSHRNRSRRSVEPFKRLPGTRPRRGELASSLLHGTTHCQLLPGAERSADPIHTSVNRHHFRGNYLLDHDVIPGSLNM
jgi:hypothetical protein